MTLKGRGTKLAILSFIAVLALTGVGVGFAHWKDQVTIIEIVETGDVCVEYTQWPTISDPFCPPPYYPLPPPTPINYRDRTCDPGFVNCRWLDKNVGCGNATYLDTDVPPDGKYDVLKVVLSNVYPCYWNHVNFWVHNCGSIPVIVSGAVLKYDDTEVFIDKGHFELDLNDNGVPDFEIKWGDDTLGEQLDPDEEWDISYSMHVLQDEDQQGRTFTFTIELVFIQWNKYVPPTPTSTPTPAATPI